MRRRFLLLAASALLLSPAFAQTPASLERELVTRALSGAWGPVEVRTELLVGQWPRTTVAPLPRLSPARLLGSVVRTSADPSFPSGASVYLDTGLSPARVSEQLRAELTKNGWTAFPPEPGPDSLGGFLPTGADAGESRRYYRLDPDATLFVQAVRRGPTTQVTLHLEADRNVRDLVRFAASERGRPEARLPNLSAPAGAVVTPRGGGGGGSNFSVTAGVRTKLTLAALAEHYAAQLRAAGWTQVSRGQTGKTIGVLWSVKRDDVFVTGLLSVREDAPGQFSALLSTFDY